MLRRGYYECGPGGLPVLTDGGIATTEGRGGTAAARKETKKMQTEENGPCDSCSGGSVRLPAREGGNGVPCRGVLQRCPPKNTGAAMRRRSRGSGQTVEATNLCPNEDIDLGSGMIRDGVGVRLGFWVRVRVGAHRPKMKQ